MTSAATDVSTEQQEARDYFLAALNDLENETNVLRGLRDNVFPIFSTEADLPCRHLSIKELRELLARGELGPFCHALVVWAESFNLLERWVLDSAVSVLGEAYKAVNHDDHPVPLQLLVWMFPVPKTELIQYRPSSSPVIDKWLEFAMHPYDGKGRTSYRKRAMAYFTARLDNYLDEMDPLYRSAGVQEVLDVRKPENYRYLVRYQVQRWRVKDIIEHYGLKKEGPGKNVKGTIYGALRTVADKVGLTLVRHPPGRPSTST